MVAAHDPTSRTTEQMLREMEHLRDEVKLGREVLDTRLTGMDKALVLLQAFTDKSPTTAAVSQAVMELAKLHEAAIGFIKEALGEQKVSTTKQLDAYKILFETTINGIDSKIDDLKSRLTVLEGRTNGVTEVRKDNRDNIALIVAIIAVLATVGLALFKH